MHDHDESLRSNTLAASGIYIPVVWGVCTGLDSACAGMVDEVHFLEFHSIHWQLFDDQFAHAGDPAVQRRFIRR